MKKLEIEALSLDEAKVKAFEQGITVIFDATRWWSISGKPTGEELLTLIIKYLQRKNAFENEGVGVVVNTIKPFVVRKQFPYVLNNNKHKHLEHERIVEIRKKSNDELVAIATHKKEAIRLAKKLISSVQEDLYGKIVYQPNRHEFELKYTPNYDYKYGQYIVFGVEDADVRASKRKRRSYI